MGILKSAGLFFLALFFILSCSTTKELPMPPKAKKINKKLTIHNHTRIDPYYWLKQRNNPEVIKYLEQENAYTQAVMKHTEDLQEKLYDEIVGRIKKDDASVPYKKNGYYYYRRYEKGLEYPLYCRKKESLQAPEEIMLNVNELAKGHEYFHVTGLSVSKDNTLLAYGVDTLGRRRYSIHFKNLHSGEIYEDEIPLTTGSSTWANDNKTVFYTVKNPQTLRSERIKKHILGDDPAGDREVYYEKDDTYSVFVTKTKSEKYLLIGSYQTLATEFRYLGADNPDGHFKIIQPRKRNHEYWVDHYKDSFYIRTNWKAKNYRLMKTSVKHTAKKYWQEVVAHRAQVLLEGMEIFKNYLVLQERKQGLIELRVMPWSREETYYLKFDEPAYVAYLSANPEFDTDELRYVYSSLTTPSSTFDFNMKSRKKKLLKQDEVVGGYDAGLYKTERLFATADDGTKIPVSLVYKKVLKKSAGNPLLLYAYGSYGYSTEPYFSSVRLSLLERGFVFAIAHVRGGQEMGRDWYENGKLLKKKNTFTDFIACARFLIKNKYTTADELFALGGSAGGLLMGAISNMAPQLFKGIIAAVPFVDVVTTMLDESIPLTTSEYDEWGDPNKKEYYDYILSYSPYDNVEAKNYPAMLVTTGLHDSQVQYWEPAKWVAKLRDMKKDKNVLLLKTDMGAGHSGVSGRFKRYKETALEYAFILDQAGILE